MNRLTLLRILVMVGIVILLEICCRAGLINNYNLIPPSEMAVTLVELLRDGKVNAEIGRTLGAIAIAVIAAVIFGILAAIILHALPRLRRAIDPVLAAYYSVPIFVFYPLFIVIFGLNDRPKVLIGFLLAVVTVIASTLNGLDRVPPVLRKTAKVLQLSRIKIVRYIVLPSAAPNIFNGIKLAIAHAFVGVLAAEFILSSGGLGYQIAYAFHDFNNKEMYAILLLILIIVALVNSVLLSWERRLRLRRGLA
jgi:NitT/TauT family transport system permease protein